MSEIEIQPVEMTPDIMQRLEELGMIMRLTPGRHTEAGLPPGQSKGTVIYQSREEYGPHRLLAVTAGRVESSGFGSHPDNEEFLLIGDPADGDLYLLLSYLRHDELDQQIRCGTVSAEQFICLRVRFNDPEVSFFTLRADVPHDAVCGREGGGVPSFYVTESSRMGVRLTAPMLSFVIRA